MPRPWVFVSNLGDQRLQSANRPLNAICLKMSRSTKKIGEHPIRRINSRVNSQVKFAALSLETLEGMPVNCQKDNMASQHFLAVRLLSETACKKQEVLFRKTRAQLYWALVLNKGPKQSM